MSVNPCSPVPNTTLNVVNHYIYQSPECSQMLTSITGSDTSARTFVVGRNT